MQSQPFSGVEEAEQEDWDEEEAPLPIRPAPHPAGPDRAAGHSPPAKAPKGASPWHSPSAGHVAGPGTHIEAVRLSPGIDPEDASNAAVATVASAVAVTSSKKRKWGQLSLKDKALAAASRVACIAAIEATDAWTATMEAAKARAAEACIAAPSTNASPAAVQPNIQQPSQGAKASPPVQIPGSKSNAQNHRMCVSPTSISPKSSLPIIISDSEDDEPTPNSGPTSKQTYTPNLMPSPSQTPLPSRRAGKPLGGSGLKGTRAAAGGSHGSAESPIVIEISDDDDDIDDCQGTVAHAAAAAESWKKVTTSTAQHDNTRHSKGTEGTPCPSASKAALEPVPFDVDSKGSAAAPLSSLGTQPFPAGTLPASKPPLMQGSTRRSPASSSPTSFQLSDASEVQECIRQAARSSALLSVSRPGRGGAVLSPASDTITASAGELLCPVAMPCCRCCQLTRLRKNAGWRSYRGIGVVGRPGNEKKQT